MFRKILVPLDGSELAENALEPAIAIAEKNNGKILLLSAAVHDLALARSRPGLGMEIVDELAMHSRNRLEVYLESVRKDREVAPVTFDLKVEEGDAAGVIVDEAASSEVDLIVMSTHGRSGITRWLMGSVTERVLRNAPCPVLAVHDEAFFKRILITLDGSELSESALEPGLAVAKLLGGQVTLLNAVPAEEFEPSLDPYPEAAGVGLEEEFEDDSGDRAKVYLERVADRCKEALGREVEVVTRTGAAASAILDYIDYREIDLVVMATHGRSGLRRWVYGSVTEKVLRKAGCAVLIVRPARPTS